MELRGRVATRTAVDVAADLRAQIQSGEIGVGSRLPPQRVMAQKLLVGRQAVSEALSLLEAEGYVITRRGAQGGSFVCQPVAPTAVWMELMRAAMNDLEDSLDFRVGVECQIARLAAKRRTDDDIKAMRTAIDSLPRDGVQRAEFREADGQFHAALSRASRNTHLEAALRRTRADLFMPTDNIPYVETVEVTRRQHEAVLRAVERQDPAAASRAVERHIEETRRHLRALVAGEARP